MKTGNLKTLVASGITVIFGLTIFSVAGAAEYPIKPITMYCAYVAGATSDLTARALAAGAEKILKVPIMVENKPGGNSTVCASLLASKKPDGYIIAVVPTSVADKPSLFKIPYDPLNSFTPILQYSRYIGGLCVHSDSPIKSIDQFTTYAKAHPGMTYGSPGQYSQQHLAVDLFAQCKGLNLKHVPYKGGAEAVTAFLGKHTDFIAGSGSHMPYVKQGSFRMLMVYNATKRDPHYPDIPMMSDLGCQDYPGIGIMVAGPKGLPAPILNKLKVAFKQVMEGPEFQKLLAQIDLPYDFKEGADIERDAPATFKWFTDFYKKIGLLK
jgi:tripartite-type tricarboxylate transporter receptor subunit TctC